MTTNNSPQLNEAQKFILVSRYSRWLDDKGRRENSWEEIASRYFSFFEEKLGDRVPEKYWTLMKKYVNEMGVLPSMRSIWTAGEALELNNAAGFNCTYLPICDLRAPAELLFLLCSGCGVGFSTEKRYIEAIPPIQKQTSDGKGTFIVGDSRIGWAESLRVLLESLWQGMDVEMDYSRIRPKGTRLKTFGGRASGPDPLKRLHEFVRTTILNAQGRQLTSLEWLDICNEVGDIVVVGGIRRAAEINFSDLNDDLIREAKTGIFHPRRFNSNNSAVYYSKPDVVTFMKEWSSLAASGTGERGVLNVEAIKNHIPKRRKFTDEFRTNPCFRGDTLIHTKQGHFQIKDLVGRCVDVWDGESWRTVNTFQVTSHDEQMLKFTIHDGSSFAVTKYHILELENGNRVEAKDVTIGEKLRISNCPNSHGTIEEAGAYLKGFLIGDGTSDIHKPILWLYEPKYICEQRLTESAKEIEYDIGDFRNNIKVLIKEEPSFRDASTDRQHRKNMQGLSVRKKELHRWTTEYKQYLPKEIFQWNLKSKLEFIAGVMDADGTASDTSNGWMYQLTSINKQWLEDFQNLLKTIGVFGKISLNKAAGKADFRDGYGEYETKDAWRLTISQEASIILAKQVRFTRLVSFAHKQTVYKLKPRFNKIVSIEEDGTDKDVYCLVTEDPDKIAITNGIIIGRCGEVILRPFEMCNLSTVIVRATDTFDDLINKVKSAVWIGAIQSCLTDFPYIRPEFKKNCDEERLLGVSLSGQMDNPDLMTEEKLKILKEYGLKECKKACTKLGINLTSSFSVVKPEGTTSQLVNSSSGIHPRYAKYYIRRYRISANDPLFRMMKDQGVVFHKENGQEHLPEDQVSTWVCEFPTKAPEGCITRHEVSAIEQLEWYLKVRKNWTEHNVSCTIYCRPEEWMRVGAWVYDHFDEVVGISFLPYDGGVYKLAPYQEISKEEYENLESKFPKIDYAQLSKYELEDNTSGSKELACSSGSCEII